MAYFPPANGDAQPVYALDINNGPQDGVITSAALVQMAGPKLDFFGVVVQNGSQQNIDLQNQLGNVTSGVITPGVIVQLNQSNQTTATISMYQVEAASSGMFSYAVYPSGAYTAATLQAQLRALGNIQITASDGTVTGVNVTGTDVVNVGFKLAAS